MSPHLHLSQSEAADWAGCPLRAHARWVMEVRPPDDEDRARRVGSMGHAIVVDSLQARFAGKVAEPLGAAEREAEKRGWGDGWAEDFAPALDAAATVCAELDLSGAKVVPDIYTGQFHGPLAEVRLRASWTQLAEFFRDGSTMSRAWKDIMWCEAVRARFAGIEGQPDLVMMNDDGSVSVVDYKFRQKPDLGGARDEPEVPVPDRQAAWYLALLHSVGLRPAGGIRFLQVNAYAGRWLTVDDFVDAAEGRAQTREQYELVTDRGLPTRDTKRMAEAGGMVTAEVWAEAHRILANARLERRLTEWRLPKISPKTGRALKQGDPPDRLSDAEERDARFFVEELKAYRPVEIRTFRADPTVCRDVVRDMIVGVDGPLAHSLRGMAPARHLQVYRNSPCTKSRGGCQIRVPCMASHGTGDVLAALRDMRDQGALVQGPRLGAAAEVLSC